MNWERRKKLIIRWAIVTAGVTALFWFIWSRVAEVPVTTVIRLTKSQVLPINLSRWWDVLAAPIWSTIFILLFTSNLAKKIEKADVLFGLGFGLAPGLAFGLVFGLGPGLAIGLAIELVSGLVFGLAGLGLGLGFRLGFGLISLIRQAVSKSNRVKELMNWLLAK